METNMELELDNHHDSNISYLSKQQIYNQIQEKLISHLEHFNSAQISAYQQELDDFYEQRKIFLDYDNKFENEVKESFLEEKEIITCDKEIIINGEDLPVSSKHYIRISQNISMLNLQQRLQKNTYIGGEYQNFRSFYAEFERECLVQNSMRNYKMVKDDYFYGITYAIGKIQEEFGSHYDYLRLLNFVLTDKQQVTYLQKINDDLLKIWTKEESSLNEKQSSQDQQKNKIYTFKYNDKFCLICYLFNCTMHFNDTSEQTEKNDLSEKIIKKQQFDQYGYYGIGLQEQLEKNPNQKNNIRSNFHFFKCQNVNFCVRKENSIQNFKFKKFIKQLIIYSIKRFQTKNSCFIAQILGKEFGITCENIACYMKSECKEFIQNINYSGKDQNQTAKKQRKQKQVINKKGRDLYVSCDHPGPCTQQNCVCMEKSTKCWKYCKCDKNCVHRFLGCKCKSKCNSRDCECYANFFECDPDLCTSCNAAQDPRQQSKEVKRNQKYCLNTNMYYNVKRRLLVGRSTICNGFGLFAGEEIKKNEFIGEYTGEIVNNTQSNDLFKLQNVIKKYYQFTLTDVLTIDSISTGNKTRFINHGKFNFENVTVRVCVVSGVLKIGFFAKKDIEPHDVIFQMKEIFFDYGDSFHVDWIKPANENMKKESAFIKLEQNKNKFNQKFNANVDLQENMLFDV